MKISGTALILGTVVVAVSWLLTHPGAAAAQSQPPQAPAKLVDETLAREAREGVSDRRELLKPALRRTPPCEEACWLCGLVFDAKRKKWLELDEVRQQAAEDKPLAAYRAIRAKYADTEAGQTELARWCTKHQLPDQARAHWTRVLNFAPYQPEARRRLGYLPIGGKWLSQGEIADNQSQIKASQAAIRRWGPQVNELLMRLAGPDRQASEQAFQELTTIKNPEVVPAIVAVFCAKGGDAALMGIEILKNLRSPQSAAALSWHAVFSPWQPVGRAAATALRDQEKSDYVPLLLEAAQMPTKPRTPTRGGPGAPGNTDGPQVRILYRLDQGVRNFSWNTVTHLNEHPYWHSIPKMRFNRATPDPVAKKTSKTVKHGGNRDTLQKREYYTVKDGRLVDRHTQYKRTVYWQKKTPIGYYIIPGKGSQAGTAPDGSGAGENASPCGVLAEATGEKGPRTPSDWVAWWYDYNEVYPPFASPPNAPNRTGAKAAEGPDTKAADGSDAKAADRPETQAQRGDCLAAGTLVCAETGPTAVEKVAVGDRIFCCDPETGCLALKPVLRKTARPAGRLLKIRAGGEEFQSGGGHVFWVAGKGWVKARDLHEGMHLHTLRGTVPVEGVERGAVQTSFSLEAADFHTFFVGKGMVLTHDNTIRSPTDHLVPGWAAHEATPSPRDVKKALNHPFSCSIIYDRADGDRL